MLYIAILFFLSAISCFFVKSLLAHAAAGKEGEFLSLQSEHSLFLREVEKLKNENMALEGMVNETRALYDITKDISRQLDEDKVFGIFKERINNYIKIKKCVFLYTKDIPEDYKDCVILPLIIDKEPKGYLVARGIAEKDGERFQVLAQQLLIMLRRSFLYKKIQELAIMDGLTQVFGRRHFLERLNEEIKRSAKFKYCFSFLMVDIDKFKGFNDKFGHLVGDAILRDVSRTIKDTIRQIDFVGRYGGEELSIVLPETDKEQALLAAERIRQAVESKDIKVYDENLRVTVSVGVSTFPGDADNANPLIEKADRALYSAKGAGRNRVCAYRS